MKINGASKGKSASNPANKPTEAPSWALTGADAQEVAERYEQAAEDRKTDQGKLRRYYLRPEADGRVVFLNGEIASKTDAEAGTTKGNFDVVFVEEHKVSIAGSRVPKYYLCTARTEACPLCEAGNFSAFVGLFVVIDTIPYEASNGKTYTNQKKIFAAKSQTVKRLAKKAKSEGGSLVGAVVENSRSDQRSATVGDDFNVVGTFPLEKIGKKIDKANWQEVVSVPDMYDELTYHTAAELRKIFHFDSPEGPGLDRPGDDAPNYAGDDDDDDELPFGEDMGSSEPETPSQGAEASSDLDDLPF